MKYFDWNPEKNIQLQRQHDICFEDVIVAISEDHVLDILEHTNKKKYGSQKVFVVQIKKYVYLAPFTEDEEKVFLNTIIPSKKATKKYIYTPYEIL